MNIQAVKEKCKEFIFGDDLTQDERDPNGTMRKKEEVITQPLKWTKGWNVPEREDKGN